MLPTLRSNLSNPLKRRHTKFSLTYIRNKNNPRLYSKKIIEEKEASKKTANLGRVKQDGTTGRFFKDINVVKVDNHYEVELDGFAMMSRGENRIKFPNPDIAMAVAADWEYFHDKIDPKRMPLYTLASMASDLTPQKRESTDESILSYMDSDSLLIRSRDNIAFEYTQMNLHDPLIQWFNETFNMNVVTSDSFFHEAPPEAIQLTKMIIEKLDPWTYTAFSNLVESSLSVILPLALWHRQISIENAVKAIIAENDAFNDRYGEIYGSSDIKRQNLFVDISSATVFLHLLNTPPPILRRKRSNSD